MADRTEEYCKRLEALINEAIEAGVDPEWLLDAAEKAVYTEPES